MNPIDLITPELIEICKDKKLIVVCGYTKTGKVTIAKKLAEELNRKLLKSDDYQMFEEQSLEMLMNDVIDSLKRKEQIIVEGILCFRLLRKGMEQMNILPDMLIKTECNEETIRHFYEKDGEESKIDRALSFNKGLDKIWKDYLNLLYYNPYIIPPEYIELNTSIK
jgi:uridine kinase